MQCLLVVVILADIGCVTRHELAHFLINLLDEQRFLHQAHPDDQRHERGEKYGCGADHTFVVLAEKRLLNDKRMLIHGA